MTFVEAVFSFVFGDGNPNENFEVGLGRPAAEKRLLPAHGCRLKLAVQLAVHVVGQASCALATAVFSNPYERTMCSSYSSVQQPL
jgi:hypothetical protein